MVTRSPFLTTSLRSAFANLHVSRVTSAYVSVRDSSGESPSQISAALFLRAVVRWRSRQFTEALSLPPMNHSIFAVWKSHLETVFHLCAQVIRSACSAQNPSGLETDRSWSARY